MKTSGNTILITGGATGIGYALAEVLHKDNKVIICGRREEKLKEAKEKLSDIKIKVCDVSKEDERRSLHSWIKENFPDINILINNAGIQRAISLRGGESALSGEDEIEVNLKAVIHLSSLFIPDFTDKDSAIVNVSSGLGFVPIAFMPIYCATKAAIHSYTLSLRHQLKDTSIKIFELIPPIVDTELDHGRRPSDRRGIPATEVSYAFLEGLKKDSPEIIVGMAGNLRNAHGDSFTENFNRMNG